MASARIRDAFGNEQIVTGRLACFALLAGMGFGVYREKLVMCFTQSYEVCVMRVLKWDVASGAA